MKFQFAQSQREITATKVSRFKVIQDNRSKEVVTIEYETKNGDREMSFLNGIEATLNNAGRYVQAQSKRDMCARILPEPEPEVTDVTQVNTETN